MEFRVPSELAEAMRRGTGRPSKEQSSTKLVKLTRNEISQNSNKNNNQSLNTNAADDGKSSICSEFKKPVVVLDSWEDLMGEEEETITCMPSPKHQIATMQIVKNDNHVDDFLSKSSHVLTTQINSNEKNNSLKIPLSSSFSKIKIQKQYDEPIILISLSRLCGFSIPIQEIPKYATKLKKDLSSQNSKEFIKHTSELFEMGAAIHGTRNGGPIFADQFGEKLNIDAISDKATTIGVSNHSIDGGAEQEEEQEETWVAIPYPSTLSIEGDKKHSNDDDDEEIETLHVWGSLFENSNALNKKNIKNEFIVISNILQLLRVTSQPLPWKYAISIELKKLGIIIKNDMIKQKLELWKQHRQERMDQLDEVRNLLLDQQRSFESELDKIVQALDLINDENVFTPYATTMDDRSDVLIPVNQTSSSSFESFAGFSSLCDDDGNIMNQQLQSSSHSISNKINKLANDKKNGNVQESESDSAKRKRLKIEETHFRYMLSALMAKLDQIDDLYGSLIDEEEEDDDEDDDDDDEDEEEEEEEEENEEGETATKAEHAIHLSSSSTASSHLEEIILPPAPPPAQSTTATVPVEKVRRILKPGSGRSSGAKQGAGVGLATQQDAEEEESDLLTVKQEGEIMNVEEKMKSLNINNNMNNKAEQGDGNPSIGQATSSTPVEVSEFDHLSTADKSALEAESLETSQKLQKKKEKEMERLISLSEPASMRLDLLDSILAMILGRLPMRPKTLLEHHYLKLAQIHAEIRKQW